MEENIFEKKESGEIGFFPAMPTDAEGINRVARDTWLATYPNEEAGISREDIEDRVKDRLSEEKIEKTRTKILEMSPNIKMFVAKEMETVVGYAAVSKGENENELDAIYVLPEYQGKGIGRKLWEECALFLSDNTKPTVCTVVTYNTQAISFYKKLGFKETGKKFTDERFRLKSGAILPLTELILERK